MHLHSKCPQFYIPELQINCIQVDETRYNRNIFPEVGRYNHYRRIIITEKFRKIQINHKSSTELKQESAILDIFRQTMIGGPISTTSYHISSNIYHISISLRSISKILPSFHAHTRITDTISSQYVTHVPIPIPVQKRRFWKKY